MKSLKLNSSWRQRETKGEVNLSFICPKYIAILMVTRVEAVQISTAHNPLPPFPLSLLILPPPLHGLLGRWWKPRCCLCLVALMTRSLRQLFRRAWPTRCNCCRRSCCCYCCSCCFFCCCCSCCCHVLLSVAATATAATAKLRVSHGQSTRPMRAENFASLTEQRDR